ncbi:polysaccharide lyase family 14 protein [Auriscalpium vulgare]|uniref:Polysaccharide lyase family 14 protein n=1 Tax=Auriscalpium vulgare TaxID=40419 RepID=A0ACB8RLE6_9AGAM|nr:polysaccharide lyase family 14 protein [Auriscalpium vulgare]
MYSPITFSLVLFTLASISSAIPTVSPPPAASSFVVVKSSSTAKNDFAAGRNHTSSPAPHPSSTSSAPPASTPSGSPGSIAALLKDLFPVSTGLVSFTTVAGAPGGLPLSDGTLRPTKEISSLPHPYVQSPGPNSKLAMQAHYSKGSWTFGSGPPGGFDMYAAGPASLNAALTSAKEATFGYSVFFPEGFEFNMGGKLPGFYGGISPAVAATCSGGSRDPDCFSTRLMWRINGAGEVYTYLPPYDEPQYAANQKQCTVPPFSECNPTYGASVGRGAFQFTPGKWTTVSQRVRLNDPGQANAEIELFANGQSVISVTGLIIADKASSRLQGMQIQTFFGGHSSNWASPTDQDAYFADFSVAVIQKF